MLWRNRLNTNFIASAGTGKTHNLVEKIFEKLLIEQININQLLVLTFTDNAATELRNRISEKIVEYLKNPEIEYQQKVHLHKQLLLVDSAYIGTFHTVFLKLLRMFPLLSKIDDSFTILPEQELSDFFDLIFEKWSLIDFDADKDSWYRMINIVKNKQESIRQIFKKIYYNRMKISFQQQEDYDELIEQKFLEAEFLYNQLIDKYREDLQTLKTILDLKQHQNSILFLNKFKNFLDFFSKQKQEQKFLDFDDIMERMLDATKNTDITKYLKEKFKYIFVDEFQDTDKTQVEILKLISNNNLYVFGDPKQSIYTWRQADLDTYFEFTQDFNQVVMDTNHRSTQKLVDFYNILFSGDIFFEDQNIPPQYKQPLKAKTSNNDSYIKLVEIITSNNNNNNKNIEIQAKITAVIVSKLIENGIKPTEIMILFRKNRDLHKFHQILSGMSIPVYTQANINLYDEPEAKLLLNILKVIDNPQNRFSLISILLSRFINISEEIIYNHRQDLFTIDHPIIHLIRELTQKKNNLSIVEIIDQIYQVITFKCNHNCESTIKKFNSLKNTAIIKAKEGYLLKDFILYLENSEEKLRIGQEENSVRLLTMHSAKGLQSEVVILPLIDRYPSKPELDKFHVYKNQPIINLPEYNIKTMLLSDNNIRTYLEKQKEYEERRLFYVALTRAKTKLIMIATKNKYKNTKGHDFYSIIDRYKEYLKDYMQIEQYEEKDISELTQQIKPLSQPTNKNTLTEQQHQHLSNIYNQAKSSRRFVSVTQLMQTENEEDEQYYQPTGLNTEEEIGLYVGTVFHKILENTDFLKFSYDEGLRLLEKTQKAIPPSIKEQVTESVKELLNKFENSEILGFLKSAKVLHKELSFVLREDDRFVEGRIDLVVKKDNTIYVIDYKTNRFSSQEEKQNILEYYKTQKKYYLEAISRIYQNSDIKFMLGLIYSGELVEIQ